MNCPFPSSVRLFCVVYFLMVERAEASYGHPLWHLIYRHRFALLAALFGFLYVVPPVRLVLRLVLRFAFRPACHLVVRLVLRSDLRAVLRIALLAYRHSCRFFLLVRGRWFP